MLSSDTLDKLEKLFFSSGELRNAETGAYIVKETAKDSISARQVSFIEEFRWFIKYLCFEILRYFFFRSSFNLLS